jgi:hypothetical protein
LVALAVSETPIMVFGSGRAAALFAALDAILTAVGAAWILHRYRALEAQYASLRVH